jgi:hypothetical protein
MNLKISTLAGLAGAMSLLAGAGQAATLFDASLAAPGVYFGSGNPNGHFAVELVDGIELGLRARPNPLAPVAPAPVSSNIYAVALGQDITFDFSFNPGADGSPVSLAGLTSQIRITRLGPGGGVASFSPLILPDNAHNAAAPGGFQNSEQLRFGFLNGTSIFGDINYDKTANATYRIDFSVSGTNFGTVSDAIFVKQGAGAFGVAVPEPSTWALTIMGFGAAGAVLRRRRALAAA